MKLIIGVSLKMYFSYQQTINWCQQVADFLQRETVLTNSPQPEMFTCPSFPVIQEALRLFANTPMAIGAQNIADSPPGAWTGETSAAMVKEMGCRYAEIGHAERRRYFQETDDIIQRKVRIALQQGLTPVVCIGETQQMTARQAIEIAIGQSSVVLHALDEQICGDIIFAWEPQWAIGADYPAADEYIREVCSGLREAIQQNQYGKHRVIYGGSAGPGLLSRLFPAVDGIFLGRFAHQPVALQSILKEAASLLANQ